MFLELLNKIALIISDLFEDLEDLNNDNYPECFVEINGERIKYG